MLDIACVLRVACSQKKKAYGNRHESLLVPLGLAQYYFTSERFFWGGVSGFSLVAVFLWRVVSGRRVRLRLL